MNEWGKNVCKNENDHDTLVWYVEGMGMKELQTEVDISVWGELWLWIRQNDYADV